MKFSLRTLFVVVTIGGCSPVLWWLSDMAFHYLLIPFIVVMVVAMCISCREFGRDLNADPPSFS